MTRAFFPNFGAEEADDDVVAAMAAPLSLLRDAFVACCPDDVRGLVAWLNTPRAARVAGERGLPLFGAAPGIVAAVHDKAFCVTVVRRAGFLPPAVQEAITVVDPAELSLARLRACASQGLAGIPHAGFTAKPRRGAAGRGRVDLRNIETNPSAVLGALPRLAQAGGVVVEPWLSRSVDVSAAFRVDDAGVPTLLGTTQAVTSGAGVWRAARMVVDGAGVRAPLSDEHAPLLSSFVEQARTVVQAAARVGYRGFCGVDGFVYEGTDGPALRVVELNARFTAGVVAVLLARRASGHGVRVFDPRRSSSLLSE